MFESETLNGHLNGKILLYISGLP